MRQEESSPTPEALRRLIAAEVANALGLARAGLPARLVALAARRTTSRFATLAAAFDANVAALGFQAAARRFLSGFIDGIRVRDAWMVPATGPLLVVANHPGATDALAIAASLPRDDVKLVLSDVPLLRALPHANAHFIYVTHDHGARLRAIRKLVDALRAGGAVLIFPGTYVVEDLDLDSGKKAHAAQNTARFDHWSRSIVVAMRQAPGTRVQTTIVSGVMARRFARHPLPRLASVRLHQDWQRRRLSEALQILYQLRTGNRLGLVPRVSFGAPLTSAELGGLADASLDRQALGVIAARAEAVLAAHMAAPKAGTFVPLGND